MGTDMAALRIQSPTRAKVQAASMKSLMKNNSHPSVVKLVPHLIFILILGFKPEEN